MITVTDLAKEKIQDALKDKGENPSVRVYIAGVGWGGPSWGLALDEPKDEDEVVAVDGFRVVAEKKLLDEYGGVTVDYMKTGWSEGFRITPGKTSTSNCGSCSC